MIQPYQTTMYTTMYTVVFMFLAIKFVIKYIHRPLNPSIYKVFLILSIT